MRGVSGLELEVLRCCALNLMDEIPEGEEAAHDAAIDELLARGLVFEAWEEKIPEDEDGPEEICTYHAATEIGRIVLAASESR